MLFVEKCAHRPGILRACFVEIEIARVNRIRMKRDQKRGVTPEGAGAAHPFSPDPDVHLRRHLEKLLRKAGFGIEGWCLFPGVPADVVLPGGEGKPPPSASARQSARCPRRAPSGRIARHGSAAGWRFSPGHPCAGASRVLAVL